jgi:CIC family chloride channel protein
MEKSLSQSAVNLRGLQVEDVAVKEPVTVYPDEAIWSAIQKMAPRDLARLPVVSRDGSGTLLGLISRSDLLRAYDVGIVRKQRGQLLEQQTSLRREKFNSFLEFRLRAGDHAVGMILEELTLPSSVNVISVEREGVIIIPRGKTDFKVADIITLFGSKDDLVATKENFIQ